MSERSFIPADSVFDPRIFATVTLLVIQISVMAAIGVAGGGWLAADARALVRFGALVRPLVWDDGEYWRLLTVMFLHGDVLHLALNGICLLYFGSRVEMALGRGRYGMLYFGSGLFASLLSLVAGEPLAIGVGASGAIFGVVVAYLMIRVRGPEPWTQVMREPASRLLFFLIGLQLAVGFLQPGVDSMAHLGGAAAGMTLGYYLVARTLRVASAPARGPWLALSLWLGASVALTGQAMRPPTGPTYHVAAAIYYFLENRVRSLAHFDQAVEADAPRALAKLDRLAGQSGAKAAVIGAFLEWFDDGPLALAYYRGRARQRASPDNLWLLITILQRPDVADSAAALAACEEGKRLFAKRLRWDLVEARIHANFRRFDDALDLLNETGKSSESLTAAFWEIAALCHLRRHEWADAERAAERCLAAPSDGLQDLQLRAGNHAAADWRYQALAALGRTTEALSLWENMERQWRAEHLQDRNDPVAMNNLAWFLATRPKTEPLRIVEGERPSTDALAGELVEARELAWQSVKRAPEAYNLDTLAWVLHNRGQHAVAWVIMDRALKGRHARRPEYWYHAAAILADLERKAVALEYLRLALAPGVDFDDFEAAENRLRTLGPQSGEKNIAGVKRPEAAPTPSRPAARSSVEIKRPNGREPDARNGSLIGA